MVPGTNKSVVLVIKLPRKSISISSSSFPPQAVYEHRTTNTPFLGSRISWNGNGWDRKLRNGSLYLFPESYYAKRGVGDTMLPIVGRP